jgi:octaprenyl-diphosphate synthase
LGRFGRLIGMAFQIIDDTLDYTGTEAEFGKPVGHDLDEGKITLPLIRTLAAARPDHRRELEDLIALDRRNPQEFARVKELIQLYRGLEQSMARAVEAVAEAKQALAVFPDVQERRDLADLGDYIVTRRK